MNELARECARVVLLGLEAGKVPLAGRSVETAEPDLRPNPHGSIPRLSERLHPVV